MISFLIPHIRILAVEVQRVCCKHDCEDTNKSHQVKRIYIKISMIIKSPNDKKIKFSGSTKTRLSSCHRPRQCCHVPLLWHKVAWIAFDHLEWFLFFYYHCSLLDLKVFLPFYNEVIFTVVKCFLTHALFCPWELFAQYQ